MVSNPPYIEAATIEGLMPEVARFEPGWPWMAGRMGLRPIGRSLPRGRARRAGGPRPVEVGEGQAPEISGFSRGRACA